MSETPAAAAPAPAPGPKPVPVPGPGAPPPAAAAPVRPPAPASTPRRRHWGVLASFVLLVALPMAVAAWYLWTRAADQYASTLGFSVRTEEASSAIELLGGITDLSGSSSSDTDILYEFIQSQELVASVDEKLDLRTLWAKADPEVDPVFAYHAPGTIEDLVDHWGRFVRISYDNGSGLIDVQVRAFEPQDARAIAQAVFDESSAMINDLSAIAREDAIGYARDELNQTVERLKEAREAVTQFRNRYQIADIESDITLTTGLLGALNQQLAEARIEFDLLRETTRESDPRITQTQRRIQVIEDQIAQERQKLGLGGDSTAAAEAENAMALRIGEYERLFVDRQFAEETYTAALSAFYSAQNEAARQSRYLAAHVRPTLAERADYPQRWLLFGMLSVFLFLVWSVLVLIYYSLRDRR